MNRWIFLAVLLFLPTSSLYARVDSSFREHMFTKQEDAGDSEKVEEDLQLVRTAAGMESGKAVSSLKWLFDQKNVHPDVREEALKVLLRRYERLPGRKARSVRAYLQRKLESKKEDTNFQEKIYDSLIGAAARSPKLALSIIKNRRVNEYVRFYGCKDLAAMKLSVGQKAVVRTTLQQLLKTKAVKESIYSKLTAEDVKQLLQKL